MSARLKLLLRVATARKGAPGAAAGVMTSTPGGVMRCSRPPLVCQSTAYMLHLAQSRHAQGAQAKGGILEPTGSEIFPPQAWNTPRLLTHASLAPCLQASYCHAHGTVHQTSHLAFCKGAQKPHHNCGRSLADKAGRPLLAGQLVVKVTLVKQQSRR